MAEVDGQTVSTELLPGDVQLLNIGHVVSKVLRVNF